MSDDLISRQAAIQEAHKGIYDFFDIVEDDDESPMTYLDEKLLEVNKAITNRLRALPAAQERKKGKWVDTGSGQECSVCHEIQYGYDNFRNYCPNCGAEMEVE